MSRTTDSTEILPVTLNYILDITMGSMAPSLKPLHNLHLSSQERCIVIAMNWFNNVEIRPFSIVYSRLFCI